MRRLTRRAFLGTSSAAFVAVLDARKTAASSEPHLEFPSAPRDRLAVASWPFRKFIEAPGNKWARDPKAPGMDLKDFGEMVVQRFSLRNIEPLSFHFASTDARYLAEFREANEKSGVRVVNVPVDFSESFYDPSPAGRKKAVETGKKWIDVALAAGSPSVRLHVAGVHGAKPDVARAAESLKQVAEYGGEKNILVNLENDDNVTEDPFFLVEVIERVNHPYLHALPDFCNSMLTHDQAFNDRALASMFKHAYNISHAKDSEVGDGGKLYTVDVAKCFEITKAAGYRGYFSMEWEGAGEPYAGTLKLIDLSVKYLS